MMTIKKQRKVQSAKSVNAEECAVCNEQDSLVQITEMSFNLREPRSIKVCVCCTKRTIHKLFQDVSVPNDAHNLEAFLEENENIKTIIYDIFKKGQAVKAVCAKGIYQALDSHVYGHANYKRAISLAFARHMSGDMKQNILVVGPTGVGKTHAIDTLGKLYDVPVASVNGAMLTASGYKGNSVDEIGKQLLKAAGGDISRAEMGAIFIDEIDKGLLGAFSNDLVASLLKLMEGDVLKTDAGYISTKNVLFIVGGTFREIFNKKRSIALSGGSKELSKDDVKNGLKEHYNLSDEFIGRLSGGITQLDRFDENDYAKMLKEQPRIALADVYKFLGKYGATLELSECFIEYASKKAVEIGLGVRGLKILVNDELNDILFDPELAKNSKITLKAQSPVENEMCA